MNHRLKRRVKKALGSERRMNAKTITAYYMLSEAMTYVSTWTLSNKILIVGKTMSEWMDFSNVGQTTTLYLKVGGKTLASAKINVKQDGPVNASMDCTPAVVPLDASTTCTVRLKLKSAEAVTLNLEEVDFGGKKVWPKGPSSVKVNKQTVTLTPTNMQEDLTITIDINDELADYYFEKSPWLSTGSYKDRLVGYSYLVEAMFSDNIEVWDIVLIIDDPSVIEKLETGIKGVGAVESILEEVAKRSGQLKFEVTVSGSLGRLAVIGSKFLGIVGWDLTLRDAINWFRAPTPSDGDNNNVIGG